MWEKNSVDNPYDLYCTDGHAFMGVFVYDKVDLSEGQTPLTVYDYHIKDIFSQRKKRPLLRKKKWFFMTERPLLQPFIQRNTMGQKTIIIVT